MEDLRTPLQALIVQWLVAPGDPVRQGDPLVVLEAMKMEHELRAPADGRLKETFFLAGEQVQVDDRLASFDALDETPPDSQAPSPAPAPPSPSPTGVLRPDLQRLLDRQRFILDAERPQAVARRRERGQRTARENIADLCD
jgi:pyruvate/2-oxoglutarate dehydrogenase complex dihydrolipoamide acyltransferase (E2) component